jgi:predicted dienelactone hydrolase
MKFATLVLASTLCCTAPAIAQSAPQSPVPSPARADYPELAQRGPHPVGVRHADFLDPNRIDFLHSNLATGKVLTADRHLYLTLWYPAASGDAHAVIHYDRHPGAGPGSPYAASAQFPQAGIGIADAAPLKGSAPLVIISHGFTNWATYTAQLGEFLASHGYVVASIDHDDIPYQNPASAGLAFVDTASGRARDQRATARQLRAWASDSAFPLAGTYDPDQLALIGYSMGGFGVLQSGGAGYDPNGALFQRIPKAPFQGILETDTKPIPGLKALVMLAPWGGQPANRSWSEAALARITVPSLVIDGDHDDVAGYDEGVHWIFDHLTSSNRYLLVFENARHNIVGADAPPDALDSFAHIEKFDEPVWRKDRIRAIDEHFILAFLDRSIRNDAAMDLYLNPPTPHSNDGVWPPTPAQPTASPYAGHDPSSAKYWPGFQRRWALGLEFYHESPTTH